jgi:hypothetical protein
MQKKHSNVLSACKKMQLLEVKQTLQADMDNSTAGAHEFVSIV